MIFKIVSEYHKQPLLDKHHRFLSWEHCYRFFKENNEMLKDPNVFDHACLHLAFYLASWGMLRGGAFLLQKDYKVHEYLIRKIFLDKKYKQYYAPDSGDSLKHQYYEGIDELIKEVKEAYSEHVSPISGKRDVISVSDTLASKIMLGLFGSVPAYDRYLISAMKMHGLHNTKFNRNSLLALVDFYKGNEDEFIKCKKLFAREHSEYTPMKLLDMYFWQAGYMMNEPHKFPEHELELISMFAEKQAVLYNTQGRVPGVNAKPSLMINES